MKHVFFIGLIATAPLSADEWLPTSNDESRMVTGVDGEFIG